MSMQNQYRPLSTRLGTHYAIFASAFATLLLVLALLEQLGARTLWLSHAMIIAPLLLYLVVAVLTRTLDLHEFYTVSRRIPPVFGGLAMAVTVMGGVGLIALTGSLYLIGFDALAVAIGWISGLVLGGVLFVPFIRKSGAYTLPGFFRLRFESPLLGAIAGLLVLPPAALLLAAELRIGAFVTSLFASVSFEAAVLWGAGLIIATVTLGGLRSLTWTQSIQYTVALAGMLVPLVVISVQETNLPLPQLTYAWLLEQLSSSETALGAGQANPAPLLGGLPGELPVAASKPFLQAFGAIGKAHFVLLTFCVLAGTAAMPALLLRSGTATHPQQARRLAGWGALFLGLFLVSAPAYAVFTKYLTLEQIVGAGPSQLPGWVSGLADAGLANFTDRNGDGILSVSEMLVSRDGVVLSLPIMAGFPFILVVLAAAGGIAATLAAAAAHTFAAGSAVSDDIYHGVFHRRATAGKRQSVARLAMALLAVGAAAYVSTRDFDALLAAIAALSFAGAAFLPALVLSVWWKRTTKWGVIAAMLTGAALAGIQLMMQTGTGASIVPGLSGLLGAVIGVPVGLAAGVGVSLLTPKPLAHIDELADDMRDPSGEALFDKSTRLSSIRSRPELPAAPPMPPAQRRAPDVPS